MLCDKLAMTSSMANLREPVENESAATSLVDEGSGTIARDEDSGTNSHIDGEQLFQIKGTSRFLL